MRVEDTKSVMSLLDAAEYSLLMLTTPKKYLYFGLRQMNLEMPLQRSISGLKLRWYSGLMNDRPSSTAGPSDSNSLLSKLKSVHV